MSVEKIRYCRFVVLAVTLSAIGAHAGEADVDRSAERFAAPGSLVSIGRHRLHLNCSGEGSPTVVFDSGLGGSSLDWIRVQPEVAGFTRACSYDRAGYGWSEPGPRPRDSSRISLELESLLGNAGVPGPFVLVGHSFGGFNVRLYSHNNPDQVAGLILVDSSHEDQFRRFDEAGVGSTAPRHGSFVLRNALSIPDGLPEEVAHVAKLFAVKRSSMTAFRSELEHLRRSAEQLRSASELPDIPVVVISHRIEYSTASASDAQRERIWMELQSELARRNSRGRHVISATKDHYIQLSQPDLIVDSIRDLVNLSHSASPPRHEDENVDKRDQGEAGRYPAHIG
jgi:pimeloyl-ACP methyl ester carboxylesterase